jgi:hypothetical protein
VQLLHSQRTDGGDKAGLVQTVPHGTQGADEDGTRNIRRYAWERSLPCGLYEARRNGCYVAETVLSQVAEVRLRR